MIKVEELLKEDEILAYFCTTDDYYNHYNCIINKDADINRLDISAALEETLHRILENGGTKDDVKFIMNAFIPTEEELEELEATESCIHIDLGYIIGGQMVYFNTSVPVA